jgi:hypothetical protein
MDSWIQDRSRIIDAIPRCTRTHATRVLGPKGGTVAAGRWPRDDLRAGARPGPPETLASLDNLVAGNPRGGPGRLMPSAAYGRTVLMKR